MICRRFVSLRVFKTLYRYHNFFLIGLLRFHTWFWSSFCISKGFKTLFSVYISSEVYITPFRLCQFTFYILNFVDLYAVYPRVFVVYPLFWPKHTKIVHYSLYIRYFLLFSDDFVSFSDDFVFFLFLFVHFLCFRISAYVFFTPNVRTLFL